MNVLLYRIKVHLAGYKKQNWPETFSSSLSSGVIASVSCELEQSNVSGKSYMTRKAIYLPTVSLFVWLKLFKDIKYVKLKSVNFPAGDDSNKLCIWDLLIQLFQASPIHLSPVGVVIKAQAD